MACYGGGGGGKAAIRPFQTEADDGRTDGVRESSNITRVVIREQWLRERKAGLVSFQFPTGSR